MSAGGLVRSARRSAGLTQQQLAARLGVSQAAVAQMEAPRANPTIATLERALRAANHRLDLRVLPAEPTIDSSLLQAALQMSPAERIIAADKLHRDAERIAASAAASRSRKSRK